MTIQAGKNRRYPETVNRRTRETRMLTTEVEATYLEADSGNCSFIIASEATVLLPLVSVAAAASFRISAPRANSVADTMPANACRTQRTIAMM
jgi:hypothetical protein